MNKLIRLVVLLGSLLIVFSVSAEIFKWTDEKGNVHFTDKPPANRKTEQLELKVNTYTAVEITPLLERLGRTDKVVIYTTSWCGICKKAKKYFRKHNIAYVAYDVEKSTIGKRDYKQLKGRAVPIIIVGNKRMNGFTASRFEKLYRKQQKKNKAANSSENRE